MKKIEKLTYCIQCTEKITGKVGDFVYHEDNPRVAISPVFTDPVEFHNWLRQRGMSVGRLGEFDIIKL